SYSAGSRFESEGAHHYQALFQGQLFRPHLTSEVRPFLVLAAHLTATYWSLLPAGHGSTLARPARTLRRQANVRRPAPSLGARRHLGPHPGARIDPIRCGGRGGLGGGLGGQRGLLDRPRPPPCKWSKSSARSGRPKMEARHAADKELGRSWGVLTTIFHLAYT